MKLLTTKIVLMLLTMQLFLLASAQSTVNDLSSLLTLDTLVLALGLATPVLTTIFKRVFRTSGNVTVAVNAALNVVAKGLLLVVSGQATWGYAIGYIVIGLLIDKAIHSAIKGQDSQAIYTANR